MQKRGGCAVHKTCGRYFLENFHREDGSSASNYETFSAHSAHVPGITFILISLKMANESRIRIATKDTANTAIILSFIGESSEPTLDEARIKFRVSVSY